MSKFKYFLLLAALFAFALTACSPAADKAITSEPVAANLAQMVNATGVVVPEQEALLSINAGGIIEEVFVEKGDQVSSGQVLVKLEGSAGQLAAVSAAEMQLVNAELALEGLYKDTELLAAEALHSGEAAVRALDDLNNPELQEAQALQAIADAEKAVADADRNLIILVKPPTQNAIDQAQGNILLAEKKHNDTLDQIEDLERQYKNYSADKNLPVEIRKDILVKIRRALKGLELKRSQERLSLNSKQTRYNELLEPPDPVDVQVAEAELATAKALLSEAEKELDRVLAGPKAGEVALLEAQINKGHHDYAIYSAGPDPKDVDLAEARISNAEAQLAAARAAIVDRELLAPFDGVITAVHVNPGEWIAPGSPVLLVGNLEKLQVETTDLGEFEVAQIMVGDPATITFDSLPEIVIQGTVARIAPKSSEGTRVNFPVLIELDQIPPALRWGMTASVAVELN